MVLNRLKMLLTTTTLLVLLIHPSFGFTFKPTSYQRTGTIRHPSYFLPRRKPSYTSNVENRIVPIENRLHRTHTLTSTSSSITSFSSSPLIRKDVLIIGGGLAGLSTALQLALSGRHVTILEKDTPLPTTTTVSGSFAAAGMLAPQSERLPKGPLLDLCLQSRRMFPDFVDCVEHFAQLSSRDDEGRKFLWDGEWEVGFRASGGFVAPAFAGDNVATWTPPEGSGTVKWLDEVQVRELEPQLHPDVVGGWWFPDDASVDARRLTCSLRAACVAAGVHIMTGSEAEAVSLDLSDGKCTGVRLSSGQTLTATSILLANGSWMRSLLPVPIIPHKGQSFSVRMPPNQPPLLHRVLFAQDTYIVPKADGRIVIGATIEPGSFDSNVTPGGMMHCMKSAIGLVPALADLPLEETWSGLRPTTPDKAPILGRTEWENLFLAGGYWRNGVLLAPKTGQLMADLMNDVLSEEDERLLRVFSWERFTSKEGGAKLAVAARYAASMHPVQRRSSGYGISAAVGTELGFYGEAPQATEERKKDREAMFGEEEEAFEKAARLGKKDGTAFTLREEEEQRASIPTDTGSASEPTQTPAGSSSLEELTDAYTVGFAQNTEQTDLDETQQTGLSSLYEQIRENKASASNRIEMGDTDPDERPDFPFRIYRVDPQTGEKHLVPPYTTPGDMDEQIRQNKAETLSPSSPIEEDYDDDDDILESLTTTDEQHEISSVYSELISELEEETTPADRNKQIRDNEAETLSPSSPTKDDDDILKSLTITDEQHEISSIYQQIRDNKAKTSIEMEDVAPVRRDDFPFRIYRVDPDTREMRMVPPYTTPGDMERMIAGEEEQQQQQQPSPEQRRQQPSEIVSEGEEETDIVDYHSEPGTTTPDETTFDGYVTIQQANKENAKEAMRKARIQNRMSAEEIDESSVGVRKQENDVF